MKVWNTAAHCLCLKKGYTLGHIQMNILPGDYLLAFHPCMKQRSKHSRSWKDIKTESPVESKHHLHVYVTHCCSCPIHTLSICLQWKTSYLLQEALIILRNTCGNFKHMAVTLRQRNHTNKEFPWSSTNFWDEIVPVIKGKNKPFHLDFVVFFTKGHLKGQPKRGLTIYIQKCIFIFKRAVESHIKVN